MTIDLDRRSVSRRRRPTGPVISARDVRVWYGTDRGAIRAVDGVSFDLAPGETLGLVGESGCGKSTLGRGLMGLLPDGAKRDGEVLFRGRDIFSLSPKAAYALRGSELGMIFQEPLTRLNPLDADLAALRGDDQAARARTCPRTRSATAPSRSSG